MTGAKRGDAGLDKGGESAATCGHEEECLGWGRQRGKRRLTGVVASACGYRAQRPAWRCLRVCPGWAPAMEVVTETGIGESKGTSAGSSRCPGPKD